MNKMIPVAYKDYTSTISTKVMACSFELSTYMWKYINKEKPVKILDLGSGFSSFIFRFYQKLNPELNCEIISVDTSEEWLEKTREFLRKYELSTDNVMTFTEFKRRNKEKYDFVLYDLGHMITRAENLKYILSFVKKGCPIIIDDVHKKVYMDKVKEIADELDLKIISLKNETLDNYGRFALRFNGKSTTPEFKDTGA